MDDTRELQRVRAEWLPEDLGVLAPSEVARRAKEVRRMLRSGRWQRLGRCVVTHSGPPTPDQLLWAAILSPRGDAALARESALRGAGVRSVPGNQITVATAWGQRPAAMAGVLYVQTRHLSAADLVTEALPRRMTPARAVVDTAARSRREWARTLLAMVVQQQKATPAEIRAVLDRLSPVRQEVLLRTTLDDVEGGAHSLPELRFISLVRAAGLPEPTRQVIRQRPDGRYFLDAKWEPYDVSAEIDGSHHRDVQQWEADVLRADELMIGGDRVLHLLSWWVRDRPELVVDLVTRALISGGWRP
jgi:very-short-patch-repair endonuclease